MIGEASEDTASISNLFAEGILDQLPEITCTFVTRQVEELMRNNGHVPSPKLHTRTVRGTVNELLKQMGVLTWKIQSSQGGVGGRSSSHSIDEWKRSIYSEIVSKAMECVENAEAKGKSKVEPDCSPVGDAGAEGKSNVRHESQETALAGTAVSSGGSVVTEWSEQDVAKYVSGLEEFGARAIEYATAMSAEHIDGKAFVLLTDDELKELGFSMGHRKNLLSRIEQLHAPAAAETSLRLSCKPRAVAMPMLRAVAMSQMPKPAGFTEVKPASVRGFSALQYALKAEVGFQGTDTTLEEEEEGPTLMPPEIPEVAGLQEP
jgi:hypothetical protein